MIIKPAAAPDIIPSLADRRWVEVDLDAAARRSGLPLATFSNPVTADMFVTNLAWMADADYSFGGYGEDRGHVLGDTYLQDKPAVHRGIDVNVSAGEEVAVAHTCMVSRVSVDKDSNGGWGGTVYCRLLEPIDTIHAFLYAHLDPDITVESGTVLRPGQIVARVGAATVNGGWFPHLHLQAFTRSTHNKYVGDIDLFDGYGKRERMEAKYPDPRPLLYFAENAPRQG